MVHFGVLNNVVLGDGALQVVLEQLLDVAGVRTRAAEKGGGLKGAAAGTHGKLLGIQYHPGQQGLRLGLEQVGGLQQVLEQLGDQLAGGGGVGLVEIESRICDIGGGPAVVVDHRHLVHRLQQILAHHLLGPVGVHHHQQAVGVGQQDGILLGEEHILVLAQPPQPLGHLAGRVLPGLLDDVHRRALLPGHGAHAGGGADAVHVGVLVAHDKHPGGVGHQLAQGVGHDPALDLGALLQLLGAAVELKVELVLDNRLVAAPAQGHLHRQGRVLEQLGQGVGVLADSDGQGGLDARGADHLPHRLQDGELALLKLGQKPLLKDKEVAVPLVPAEQPLGRGHPLGQPLVDAAAHGGAGGVGGPLHQLLIVVHGENPHHRPGGIVDVPHLGEVGDVHPVGGGQVAPPALILGADQVAEDQEAPLPEAHLGGALSLALHEPAGGEVRHRRGDFGVEQVLPLAGELEKAVVGPDDLVVLRPEDHHGQRGVDHGILGGRVHVAGDALDVFDDLLLPLGVAAPEVEVEHRHHRRLDHRHCHAEQRRHRGEEEQEHKVEPQAGLQQMGQLVFPH